MNICIVYSNKPFSSKNTTSKLVDALINALSAEHSLEIVRIPYTAVSKAEILLQTLAFRGIILENTHCLITVDSPSCYIFHVAHIAIFTSVPELLIQEEFDKISYILADKKTMQKMKQLSNITYYDSDVEKKVLKIIKKIS